MDLQIIAENLEYVGAIVLGVLSFVSAVIPAWRNKIKSFFKKNYEKSCRYRTRKVFDQQQEIIDILQEQVPIWNECVEATKDNQKQILNLTKIVRNGLSHSVAKMVVRMDQDFKMELEPKFLCDESGNNWGVSIGYQKLIGVSSRLLSGHQWQSVLYGEDKTNYMKSFEKASVDKIDFFGVADFQNPVTGEHRGRWRVAAFCSVVGESLIYSGKFIKAEDEMAEQIALDNGWTYLVGEEGQM